MGFVNIKAYADAFTNGQSLTSTFRKVPSQASTAGWWVDISMAAGNPQPNYYAAAPLIAIPLSTTRVDKDDPLPGIFHGAAQSPGTKHLASLSLMSPTAAMVGQYMLLDYLLYYPFIDTDAVGDIQTLTNIVTLPRYTDGVGLMVMAVALSPTTGSGVFTFNYIDSDGNAQTSPTQNCATTAANISTIITSQQNVLGSPGGPFLALASGSKGIRSITDVTFSVPNGGVIALVIVKPLADTIIREINTEKEVSYVNARPAPPRIYDNAYLNLICNPAGSVAAGILIGNATFVWST